MKFSSLGMYIVGMYREVHLDLRIEVFHMLFERCHTLKDRKRSIKQHIKDLNFRNKIQLDHPVVIFGHFEPSNE